MNCGAKLRRSLVEILDLTGLSGLGLIRQVSVSVASPWPGFSLSHCAALMNHSIILVR